MTLAEDQSMRYSGIELDNGPTTFGDPLAPLVAFAKRLGMQAHPTGSTYIVGYGKDLDVVALCSCTEQSSETCYSELSQSGYLNQGRYVERGPFEFVSWRLDPYYQASEFHSKNACLIW